MKLWVASSHSLVKAALQHHPLLRVRPPAEPVPPALVGTPAGEVFAQLVRMNDGEFHALHKDAVQRAAGHFSLAAVAGAASDAALDLACRRNANEWLGDLPVQIMARLLGVSQTLLDRTVEWVQALVRGLVPLASAQAIARANEAAQALMAQGHSQGLDAVQCANRIGLMQQSLDATAGLLGNTVLLLQRRPEFLADPELPAWRSVVAEVPNARIPVFN